MRRKQYKGAWYIAYTTNSPLSSAISCLNFMLTDHGGSSREIVEIVTMTSSYEAQTAALWKNICVWNMKAQFCGWGNGSTDIK